jgi:hypothetical protein
MPSDVAGGGLPPVVSCRVMAAMSMPRLAFTDNLYSVMALAGMGIEVRRQSGVFWEQSLSRLLYQAVADDFDYVLTIDYDTVFRPVDVKHLIRMMAATPEAAAIFPVQYRREQDQILLGIPGCDGEADAGVFREQLVLADKGHFGLTLLRVSALKALPHPWLWSQPNTEGKWEDGGVDADIYFWRKLNEHGMKAFCASRVVIGHIQQMITWPGEGYRPVHQYIGRYYGDGDAPREVIEAAAARAGYVGDVR